jgi:dihydroflavonol-4-reductase
VGAHRPVLVTGATGFFGGNLARALVERGDRVRVLVRSGARPVALDGLDYEPAEGDLRDERAVERATVGCGQVYHAAAALVFWCRDSDEYDEVRRVNVGGTLNVLRAAARAGVDRVVHVSTADTIGLPPPGQVADETTDWPPGRIDNPYANTKRDAERVALTADVDTVVVNPTFMIGPFDPKPSSGRLLRPLAAGRVIAHPRRGGNNFVDVRDVVSGTIAAMTGGRSRERYLLGHVNLTYGGLFDRALSVVGRRALRIPVPCAAAVGVARLLESVSRRTGRPPRLPVSLARLGCADHYYAPAKAVRDLGLPQTPIEEALGDAYAWWAHRA